VGSLSSTITDRTDAQIGRKHVAGDPRIVHTFEPKGYDKTLAAETSLYWSDVGFTTDAADTPASTPMYSRLTPVTIEASLRGPDAHTGDHRGLPGLNNFASPTFNIVRLTNSDVDPDSLAGSLDKYADRDLWSFAGRKAFLKIGADDLAYTAFEEIMGGAFTIQGEPFWGDTGDLLFVLAPPLAGFGQPFQTHTYGGFGLELDFDGSTTWVNYGNEWNIGKQDCCLEWQVSYPDNATARRIHQKRATRSGATDDGYSLYLTTGKQLIVDFSDGTNDGLINLGAASAYDDGTRRMFSVSIDWTAEEIEAFVSHYVAGVATTTSLGTLSITGWGAITNTLIGVGGAAVGGASPTFDGTLGEFRVWRKARARAQIKSEAFQTMTGSENGLAACFKFDDRTLAGTTAWQNVVLPGLESVNFAANTHEISHGDVYDIDPSATSPAENLVVGRWFKTGSSAGTPIIIGNRTAYAATNTGYDLAINTSGAVVAVADDGTTRVIAASAGTDFDHDVWHFGALRITGGASATIEAMTMTHRNASIAKVSQSISALGTLSNANGLTAGRISGGTANALTGNVGHGFAIDSTNALTDAEIVSLARYMWNLDTITMPRDGVDSLENAGSSSFWNTLDGTGTTVTDNFNGVNGTLSIGTTWDTQDATLNGTVAFVSSLDGDAGLGERNDESNIQGLRVPHGWGRMVGVRPVLVDNGDDASATAKPVYQFGDPLQGAMEAGAAFYSGGLVLTGGGSEYNTPDLTNNTVEMTSPKNEVVTGDIRGYVDGSSNLIDRTGAIASELFTLAGETTQNAASFTALDTDYPAQVGLFLDTDDHLTEEVIDGCLRPSCWGVKNIAGEIEVGLYKNLDGAAADFALTTANVLEDGIEIETVFPPATKIEFGFHRNWTPLTSFLDAVQTPEQERQAKLYWKTTAPVITDVKTAALDAQSIYVTSHIHKKRDATEEAQRLAGIYNRSTYILRVSLSADLYKAEIGDTVSLTYPRFGFSAGKNFMCIGYGYPVNPYLLLWGPFQIA